jgi:hypothetical protein
LAAGAGWEKGGGVLPRPGLGERRRVAAAASQGKGRRGASTRGVDRERMKNYMRRMGRCEN